MAIVVVIAAEVSATVLLVAFLLVTAQGFSVVVKPVSFEPPLVRELLWSAGRRAPIWSGDAPSASGG